MNLEETVFSFISSSFRIKARFCLIPVNYNLPGCGYFAVKFQRIVCYLHVEGLFAAVDFKAGWHSPRVPAGAGSAEGHDALGDLFAVGPCYNHFWIE